MARPTGRNFAGEPTEFKGYSKVIERITSGPAGGPAVDTFEALEVMGPKAPAPKTFKFPLDDISAGNFWTRLVVNSWVPMKTPEIEKGANHALTTTLIAQIWLPMPLSLSTAYNQNYTESDNMMLNRAQMNANIGDMKGFGNTFMKAASVVGSQGKVAGTAALNEGAAFVSAIANVNNSGKMNLGSVMNQQMGLVYDGATLRSHTLSWRMTPKDRIEQKEIQKIIFALKKFSSPVVKGPLGGEPTTSSKEAHMKAADEAAAAATDRAKAGTAVSNAGGSMRSIGRLGIPATVNVEFWYGGKINPHLFQIKDSFILSVEVNYTPTGTWNAYEDGAPIETQITMSLKENAIVTAEDIKEAGGY